MSDSRKIVSIIVKGLNPTTNATWILCSGQAEVEALLGYFSEDRITEISSDRPEYLIDYRLPEDRDRLFSDWVAWRMAQ